MKLEAYLGVIFVCLIVYLFILLGDIGHVHVSALEYQASYSSNSQRLCIFTELRPLFAIAKLKTMQKKFTPVHQQQKDDLWPICP